MSGLEITCVEMIMRSLKDSHVLVGKALEAYQASNTFTLACFFYGIYIYGVEIR